MPLLALWLLAVTKLHRHHFEFPIGLPEQLSGFLLTGLAKGVKKGHSVFYGGKMSPAVARAATRLLETQRADQRLHQRYPIILKVEYKLLIKGRVERLGSGRTMNISSGGIFFESDEPLPTRGRIELAMEWPFLLEGVCALKLVMRGRIVRHDPKGVAVQIAKHEFRTAGTRAGSHPTK
jgi:hypothetical protein